MREWEEGRGEEMTERDREVKEKERREGDNMGIANLSACQPAAE
jgi:hypothetical protein